MCKYKSLQEVQLPREHLSFLQNFIITKYLKQEVDDDLSVCVDERSLCGLSITGDKSFINVTWSKGNDIASTNREVLYRLPPRNCFCCLNLIMAAPLWLWIKRFVRWLWANDITTTWSIQWNSFNHVYQVYKFDVSSFFVTGEI